MNAQSQRRCKSMQGNHVTNSRAQEGSKEVNLGDIHFILNHE
jgi:hypothetical protein